jgi:TM2 domain-containing membrane protein YozV
MVNSYTGNQILSKSIAFGAVGGFAAGLVMSPFLIVIPILTGMSPDTMLIAMGLIFGAFSNSSAMTIGFGTHMLTSILIGIIFGSVTSFVGRLMITRFRKGIIEGIITGIIAFVVLFIPITITVMPPILMKLAMQMNPSMTQQEIMSGMQQNVPTMFGLGIIEHMVYGVALGAVTAYLILRTGIKRDYEEQQHTKEGWK